MSKDNKKGNCQCKNIERRLLRFDQFGVQVSTFTVDGENFVSSRITFLITILFCLTVFIYTITQFVSIINRSNYKIEILNVNQNFDTDYKINLNDTRFKLAIGIRGTNDFNIKDDPNYVQWLFRIRNTITSPSGQIENYIPVKTHICNEKDWSQFYPPLKDASSQILSLQQTNRMICFDDNQDLTIFGTLKDTGAYTDIVQRLEILFLACVPNPIAGTCLNQTLENTIKWLGPAAIYQIYNRERFVQNKFQDNGIIRESIVQYQQFDTKNPNHLNTYIQTNSLHDSIDFFPSLTSKNLLVYDRGPSDIGQSSWIDYPKKYKFTGVSVYNGHNSVSYTRTNDTIFDLISSVGGFMRGIQLVFTIVIGFYSNFSAKVKMVNKLFYTKQFDHSKETEQNQPNDGNQDDIKEEFKKRIPIPDMTIKQIIWGCLCRNKEHLRSFKLQQKAIHRFEREMDIIKFITQMRRNKTMFATILTDEQKKFKQQLSQKVVHHSDDAHSDHSDGKESDFSYIDKIIASDDPIDKRIVNYYWTNKNKTNQGIPNQKTQQNIITNINIAQPQATANISLQESQSQLECQLEDLDNSTSIQLQNEESIHVDLTSFQGLNNTNNTNSYELRFPSNTKIKSVSKKKPKLMLIGQMVNNL